MTKHFPWAMPSQLEHSHAGEGLGDPPGGSMQAWCDLTVLNSLCTDVRAGTAGSVFLSRFDKSSGSLEALPAGPVLWLHGHQDESCYCGLIRLPINSV